MSSANKSGGKNFSNFKQNSTSSDKTINKYNTYCSLYSINSEKKKLENQGTPRHMSLDRSYCGRKWRQDAREIIFQPPSFQAPVIASEGTESPKHTFEQKKIQSPNIKRKFKDKQKNPFERTEWENQDFNIMLNSELLKLKKFFAQGDNDDDGETEGQGHTNATFEKDSKKVAQDNPVTLIL